MKRSWVFIVVLIVAVLGVFTFNFFSQPKPLEELLRGGTEVALDDFSLTARHESDNCDDINEGNEINGFTWGTLTLDEIKWIPFTVGRDGGGVRSIGFYDPGLNNERNGNLGSYSVLINEGKIELSVDETCYSEDGNIIIVRYELNRYYDFSDLSNIKFDILELEGKFELSVVFSNTQSRSRESYNYSITSTGNQQVSIKELKQDSTFDWNRVNSISIGFSGFGKLVVSQIKLQP